MLPKIFYAHGGRQQQQQPVFEIALRGGAGLFAGVEGGRSRDACGVLRTLEGFLVSFSFSCRDFKFYGGVWVSIKTVAAAVDD